MQSRCSIFPVFNLVLCNCRIGAVSVFYSVVWAQRRRKNKLNVGMFPPGLWAVLLAHYVIILNRFNITFGIKRWCLSRPNSEPKAKTKFFTRFFFCEIESEPGLNVWRTISSFFWTLGCVWTAVGMADLSWSAAISDFTLYILNSCKIFVLHEYEIKTFLCSWSFRWLTICVVDYFWLVLAFVVFVQLIYWKIMNKLPEFRALNRFRQILLDKNSRMPSVDEVAAAQNLLDAEVLIVGLAPCRGMLKSSRHLGIFLRNFKPLRNAALCMCWVWKRPILFSSHVLSTQTLSKSPKSEFGSAPSCERNPSRHMAKRC